MLPQVTAAYNRVAAAARAALSASGTGTAGSIPGYAVGTQSAAPGFALVGENGPELVYFNGGEQVMTAEETAAMRESMEIQAITFAPQLLEALHAIHGDGALSAEPGAGSGAGSVPSLPQTLFRLRAVVHESMILSSKSETAVRKSSICTPRKHSNCSTSLGTANILKKSLIMMRS